MGAGNMRVCTSDAWVGHATYNTQRMNALPVVNTHATCNKMQPGNQKHVFSLTNYGMHTTTDISYLWPGGMRGSDCQISKQQMFRIDTGQSMPDRAMHDTLDQN